MREMSENLNWFFVLETKISGVPKASLNFLKNFPKDET